MRRTFYRFFMPTLCLLPSLGLLGCKFRGGESSANQLAATGQSSASGDPHLFLSIRGTGSENSALEYYKKIGADREAPTLQDFKQKFLPASEPTVSAYYQNVGDLGFWRAMTCTREIGRGKGGCYVTNWANEQDKATFEDATTFRIPDPDGSILSEGVLVRNQGTVAMTISSQGFVRFYVYGPNGALSPKAVLDPEGAKSPPQVCTSCHGGAYDERSPKLGSLFREFEPSWLKPASRSKDAKKNQADAEREWFALNQVVKKANQSIADASPSSDTAYSNQSITNHIDDIYADTGKANNQDPRGRSIYDVRSMPKSWSQPEASSKAKAAKEALWTDFVAPYCMPCHRATSLTFEKFDSFKRLLKIDLVSGRTRIDTLLKADSQLILNVSQNTPANVRQKIIDDFGSALMPHAYQTYLNLVKGNPLLSESERRQRLILPRLKNLIQDLGGAGK